MTQYIVQRVIQTLVVILILSVICFFLMHLLPGDPALSLLGEEPTQEEIERVRAELGLDRPVIVQYFSWLADAVRGDLGTSIKYREDVTSLILHRLTPTLHIGVVSFVISVVLGVAAGVIASIRRGGWLDSLITISANLGMAVPNFWLGILGIYFFSLYLGWLPVQGYVSPAEDFWESTKRIIMPCLVLGCSSMAGLARQTRSSMLEVIRQDYIRTAKAKGLKRKVVLYKHALKNAVIPVITLCGLMLPNIIGGSVIIEQVYNINGIGRLMLTAVFDRDIIVVQGCLIMISITVALANLLVDISYGYFNPRIRYR